MPQFRHVLQRAKRWLVTLAAPEGTRRRRFFQEGKQALRNIVQQRRHPGLAPPELSVYDAKSFAAFLRHCGAPRLKWSVRGAARSELKAARLALGLLQTEPSLRQQFPNALSAGTGGAYCQWLCSEGARKLKLSPGAVKNIQAAFQRRLGARVLQLFDCDAELARMLSLALTPCQRHLFAYHLLTASKRDAGLCDEEIWWYLFESLEDVSGGLIATYLRTPDWQRRFPLALTPAGWHQFVAWAEAQIGFQRAWLENSSMPCFPKAVQGTPPAFTSAQPAGVNVMGHFCYPSGLGQALHAVARGLDRAGIRTSCRDIPASFRNDRPAHADYLGLEMFDQTLILMAPEPDLSKCFAAARLHPRDNVYRIAIWYWELENIPRELAQPYAHVVQEIWAPTEFIARAMRKTFSQPVATMFPGVELDSVPTIPRRQFRLPEERFLFLFMFDMCSTMARKNPLALLRAYRQAFRRDDRVALAIKVSRGESDPDGLRCLRQAAKEAGAVLIDSVLSREEAYGLLKCADCYASLHRSEGFGLTMAESMLLGKPVIGTGYSGNVDFMTPTNSLLVEYQRVPITSEVQFYGKGNIWAEPSVAHAAQCMRWVYEHQEEARVLGWRARDEMRSLLSFEASGKRMAERLRELHSAGYHLRAGAA
jgi:glycosyltransferase involved in cell wall biosynthesis